VKITEDWRKLHNEKLHDFYFSNIMVTKSKRKRWGGGAGGRQGENRSAYIVVVGKHEKKRRA